MHSLYCVTHPNCKVIIQLLIYSVDKQVYVFSNRTSESLKERNIDIKIRIRSPIPFNLQEYISNYVVYILFYNIYLLYLAILLA